VPTPNSSPSTSRSTSFWQAPSREVHGAQDVAEELAVFGSRARFADVATVEGSPGLMSLHMANCSWPS
jgi:hypothetical protein